MNSIVKWHLMVTLTITILEFLLLYPTFEKERNYVLQDKMESPIVLKRGLEVKQVFTSPRDNLSAIGFNIGTYGRRNHCHIRVELKSIQSPGNVLVQTELNTSTFHDNEYQFISFPEINKSKGKGYELLLVSQDASPNNQVAVWSSSTGSARTGLLQVGEREQTGAICLAVKYRLGVTGFIHLVSSRLETHSVAVTELIIILILAINSLLSALVYRAKYLDPASE